MREKNPNHWIDRWLSDLKETRTAHFNNDRSEKPLTVIADDVRYENELELIQQGGGYTFFLTPGSRELPEASADWRTHESEMLANTLIGNPELAKQTFDYVVLNEGNEEDLNKWAISTLKLVLGWPGDETTMCDCEGCLAAIENRPVDQDQIARELEDLLDDLEQQGDDDDDD